MFSELQVFSLALLVALILCYNPVSKVIIINIQSYIKIISDKIRKSFDTKDDSNLLLDQAIIRKKEVQEKASSIIKDAHQEVRHMLIKNMKDIDGDRLHIMHGMRLHMEKCYDNFLVVFHADCLIIAKNTLQNKLLDLDSKTDKYCLLNSLAIKKAFKK